ncbi:MAG: leucine-rich repeat domain-containing protein [Mycoplasma sp.]|nr:leucine-rich repeat domain-containing protein [Mycoplasma sp.]
MLVSNIIFVNMLNKRKRILLTSSILMSPLIVISTMSCSAKNNDSELINNNLEKLVNEEKIVVNVNPLGIPKSYFDIYKTNEKEKQKFFFIQTNSEGLELKLDVLDDLSYDNENNIKALIRLTNLKNDESYQYMFESYHYGFKTESEYIISANREIANSIVLKPEYVNSNLVELLKETKTNQEFIDKYIDKDTVLKNVVGIDYKLKIRTQNLNMINPINNYFKFNLELISLATNENITPPTSQVTPYLNIKDSQKTTFTIINNDDLTSNNLNNLNSLYFGETLIRIEQENSSIEINSDLSRRDIVGEFDLSHFNHVTFTSEAKFIGNKITNLIFNSNATIENLNSNMFSNNLINDVVLPREVVNYNPDCFDSFTKVYGINNIKDLSLVYDSKTNDLKLNVIDEDNADRDKLLDNILKLVTNTFTSRNKLIFNKVYLPTFKTNTLSKYNLTCDEIIFTSKKDNNDYSFENNISNWKINRVNIPSFIVSINKNFLPSNSSTIISREFNEKIKKLISNKELNINSKNIFEFNNLSLISEIANLDNYFYSFSSQPLEINVINFDDEAININYSLSNILFFKNNISNKTINIKSTTKSLTQLSWDYLNTFASNNNAVIIREKWLDNSILDDSGILYLSQLYSNNELKNSNTNLSNFLVGYEGYIKSINLSNVNEIKSNTFQGLKKWNNINIELTSNIDTISDSAFKNSDIKIILNNNFNPNSIYREAFSNSTILGNLNFSNLKLLGENSFNNTNIESIDFGLLENIPNYAFSNCYSLTSINLPNVTTIGNYAFSNCSKLNMFDFSKLTSIGNYAFNYCSNLDGEIILNSDVNLGINTFQGINKNATIKNFNFDKYTIVNNLFSLSQSSLPNVISSNDSDYLYQQLKFDKNKKIWDLSSFTKEKWNDKLWANNFWLFSNLIKGWKGDDAIINEVILPTENEINNNLYYVFTSNLTIKKLTWSGEIKKNISKSWNATFGNARIQSVNEDFCVGMSSISIIFPQSISNTKFNLQGVTKINNNVFQNINNVEFINTLDVKEIGEKSFSSSSSFVIGTNVKLKQNSFSSEGLPNTGKITRNKIFEPIPSSINYGLIYNQMTKVLDFTKIEIFDPTDSNRLANFKNISSYLLPNDVQKIILPKLYVLSTDFFSNLGHVEEIVFQKENQIILNNSFANTTILKKPLKSETSIILDLDNFF